MGIRFLMLDNAVLEKLGRKIDARRFRKIIFKASDYTTLCPEDEARGRAMFKPRDAIEQEFWNLICDEIKITATRYMKLKEDGKLGGRPKKPENSNCSKNAQIEKSAEKTTIKENRIVATPEKKVNDLLNKFSINHNARKADLHTVQITPDFDLTRLNDPIGEAMRMRYPPNKSDLLYRLSKWLKSPNNSFVGTRVDSVWLSRQADNFFNKK